MNNLKEMEDFIKKYEKSIDPDHMEIKSPFQFVYSTYGLHRKSCHYAENSDVLMDNICSCAVVWSRHQSVKNIFNLYRVLFREPRLEFN